MISKLLFDNDALEDLRVSIDNIDYAFIRLLAERLRTFIKIGLLKKDVGWGDVYGLQKDKVINETLLTADELKLDVEMVSKILDLNFKESIRLLKEFGNGFGLNLNEVFREIDIEALRGDLQHIELSICYILYERFQFVRRVGVLKKKRSLQILDEMRWRKLLAKRKLYAESLDMDFSYLENVFDLIHETALNEESLI